MNKGFILATAIQNLCPDAQFSVDDFDLENINWIAGTNPPTAESIRAEMIKVVADFEAEAEAKAAQKAALLDRLGITEDEAKLLLA